MKETICNSLFAGKSKVAQDLGMPDDTDNFLIQEENELARLDRVYDSHLDIHAETTSPKGIKPPATTVSHETFDEKELHTNANMALHTTMHIPPSTGSIYLPTPKFSTQPHGNLYFNMENPSFTHPYQHLYYPQYQSAFTSINPHVQSNSTFTNTNPHLQYSSAFTNTNPHVQSNSTITNINPHVPPNSSFTNTNPDVHDQSNLTFTKTDPQIQSTSTSVTNTTLLDLADVALQQKL